jgi:hypothetical protein
MRTKIFLSALIAVMALLLGSCSMKVIVFVKNASGVSYSLSLDGKSYDISDNSVLELMYLRGDFVLTDKNGGKQYAYECPPVPNEFIERRFFNNRVRLLIDQSMSIYIIQPGAEAFSKLDSQPLGFPIRPRACLVNTGN